MPFWLILVILLFCKFAINLYYYFRTNYITDLYGKWLKDQSTAIYNRVHIAISVVNKAKALKEFTWFGQYHGVFDGFPTKQPPNSEYCLRSLAHASGIFKQRMIDTVNPIYWLEILFSLPEKVISYISQNPEKTRVKSILNVIFRIIAFIAVTFYTLYPDKARTFISNISNVFCLSP